MFESVFNLFFGCSHRNTTFPMTPARRGNIVGSNYSGPKRNNTYVVCVDCGKEFDYNWKDMRVGEQVRAGSAAHAESLSVAK